MKILVANGAQCGYGIAFSIAPPVQAFYPVSSNVNLRPSLLTLSQVMKSG